MIVPALSLSALLTGCGSMGGSKAKAAPAASAATPAAQALAAQQDPRYKWILSTAEKKWPINAATKAKTRHCDVWLPQDVVVAQVKYQDKPLPGLFRVIGDNEQNELHRPRHHPDRS